MTKVLVTEQYLIDTGEAIRLKNGTSATYRPSQFGSAITAIPTGGNTDSKSITANGTYDAEDDDLDGYSSVTVNVPNSYTASDEGKVVSSGALVSQTSTTKNANGTYDTTLNDEVVINVPNSYSQSDEGKVVSSGALVSQTSLSVSANGTYDTTTNDEVTVNVSGGGSALGTKSITANGTYDAQDDSLDGYSQVTVNVQGGGGGDTSWENVIFGGVSGSVHLTALTEIASTSVRTISYITAITADLVETIGSYALSSMSTLEHVSFPACTWIGSSAFSGCKSLTTVSFPACTRMGWGVFASCFALESANFPLCEYVGSSAFQNCSALSQVSFPACSEIGDRAFNNCKALTDVYFPSCEVINANAFQGCTSLAAASFPKLKLMWGSAFLQCSNLQSLYLLGSSVVSLAATTAFNSTPMKDSTLTGSYGSIFVPSSLYSTYMASRSWSAYSSRFASYTG